MGKIKIVLDADVVIDFKDGNRLLDLPKVLASCNLNDTKAYCNANGITYVTFLDLVWYAWRNGVMNEDECNQCIRDAIAAGNKIPNIKIAEYIPTIELTPAGERPSRTKMAIRA